jgi:hypothetical protein
MRLKHVAQLLFIVPQKRKPGSDYGITVLNPSPYLLLSEIIQFLFSSELLLASSS